MDHQLEEEGEVEEDHRLHLKEEVEVEEEHHLVGEEVEEGVLILQELVAVAEEEVHHQGVHAATHT